MADHEERLSAFIGTTGDGMIVIDGQGLVRSLNCPAFYDSGRTPICRV
jgi:hypothetical protein